MKEPNRPNIDALFSFREFFKSNAIFSLEIDLYLV